MKEHKWTKKGICGLLIGLLLAQTVVIAKTEEPEGMKKGDLFIQKKLFSTDTKEVGSDKFEGSITVDGERYILQEVKQEVVDQTPVKIETPEEITIDSEPMDTEYKPEQTIEKDGVTYTLEKVEEKEKQEVSNQTVTGYTDYDKAVTRASVPATKQVTVKDNQTGENKTVTCTLTDVTPLAEGGWEDTHIDITFESYDSNVFRWNGVTVGKDTSTPLAGYENKLLQSVGADTSKYRVLRTYWTGQPYTDGNGVLCRNARADVQRKVSYYRANYKGVIEHPERTVYTATYKGMKKIESEDEYTYTVKMTATYKLDNSILSASGVAAIMGIALVLLLVVWILFVMRKKKKHKEDS